MTGFIEFTRDNSTPIIINIDRIDGFFKCSDEDVTRIYVGGSEYPFYVKETVEEIKKKINDCLAYM